MREEKVGTELLITGHFVNNKKSLINKINRRVFDIQDAEDVLMDAFIKAISYQDSFDSKQEMGKWFNTILNNSIRDYRTKFLKEKSGANHNDMVEFDETVEGMAVEDKNLEIDWATVDAVHAEIAERSGNTNTVLRMYFNDSYSPKDIAALTNTTSHVVRNMIHRFKQEMRKKYEKV